MPAGRYRMGWVSKTFASGLSILYDDHFELETVNDGQYFTASLKVPLHESTVHDS
jgi:hypothetical protein